jgi:hypothetical protein
VCADARGKSGPAEPSRTRKGCVALLAEAVTLSMIGGLLGVAIGSVLARVVASHLDPIEALR